MRSACGPAHVEVAVTLTNLGVAHNALGRDEEKRRHLERARRTFNRALGLDHRHMRFCEEQLVSGGREPEPPRPRRIPPFPREARRTPPGRDVLALQI